MLVKVRDARLNKVLVGQGLPTRDYAEIEVNLTAGETADARAQEIGTVILTQAFAAASSFTLNSSLFSSRNLTN